MLDLFRKLISRKKKESEYEEFDWSAVKEINILDKEVELQESIIIEGHHQSNIYLNQGVHIWIKGRIDGSVIGHEKNMVKISGKLNGLISTHFLQCLEGCEISGGVSISQLSVQEGIKLDVKAIPKEETEVLTYASSRKVNIFRSKEFIELIKRIKQI